MSFTLPGSTVQPLNRLSGSSLNTRLQGPHKIHYPQRWGMGPTQQWYDRQPSKGFTHLQYRKELEGPFYHEYIVAELDNDTVCRFDRRGDVTTRANAFTMEGITAEDTAHVIHKGEEHYKEVKNKSKLLLYIRFPNGQDLLTILAICYGVQKDDAARAYTLTKYNCYFFSWTIIPVTARRTVDWALLGKETHRWEELVRNIIGSLGSESSFGHRKARAHSTLAVGRESDAAHPPDGDIIPFTSTSYLISILRQALLNTRTTIQKSLGEQILRTTVEPCVRMIFESLSKEAALDAARSHAGQAARDAAMEAIIESMWRTILSSENGGQLWGGQCKMVEKIVWQAANAAAAADSSSDLEAPRDADDRVKSWEVAWDATWKEGWKLNSSNWKTRSKNTSDDPWKEYVSSCAKSVWRRAWVEAREANGDYVPFVRDGLVEYVNKNLPESAPDVLEIIDTDAENKHHAVFRSFGHEKTNLGLQAFIQNRIADHCQKVANLGVAPSLVIRGELEEAMRRVWVLSTNPDAV